MSESRTYSGWTIDDREAWRGSDRIPLRSGDGVRIEGAWGSPPASGGTAISGICLWDARWQVEFPKLGKGNAPARWTFAIRAERERLLERVRKGVRPHLIRIPREPGEYHRAMIRWQAEMYARHRPEQVLYHLPFAEYCAYIQQLERALDSAVGSLYFFLHAFCDLLGLLLEEELGRAGYPSDRLRIISPMEDRGLETCEESFSHPYRHPSTYCDDVGSLYGIEDLSEVRSAIDARDDHGIVIPVRCAAVDVPDPYYRKSDALDDAKTITLSLEEAAAPTAYHQWLKDLHSRSAK